MKIENRKFLKIGKMIEETIFEFLFPIFKFFQKHVWETLYIYEYMYTCMYEYILIRDMCIHYISNYIYVYI